MSDHALQTFTSAFVVLVDTELRRSAIVVFSSNGQLTSCHPLGPGQSQPLNVVRPGETKLFSRVRCYQRHFTPCLTWSWKESEMLHFEMFRRTVEIVEIVDHDLMSRAAYMIEGLELGANMMFAVGSMCFLPAYAHDMDVFLLGCGLFVFGSFVYCCITIYTLLRVPREPTVMCIGQAVPFFCGVFLSQIKS